MSQHRIRESSCLAALTVLVAVSSAMASDDKVFNGSMCTFTEDGEYDGQDRSSIKLANVSGETQDVGCPLKRDIADHAIREAYIIGSATIDEDTCTLWSREDDASYQTWSHDEVVSVAASYNKTTFSSGDGTLAPDDFASLQITCDVPDDGVILSYYLWED
jgi:hypothetical protein